MNGVMRLVLSAICLAMLGGCSDQRAADLVILDGRIHTVDPEVGVVEALAVIGEEIAAVGTTRDIRKWVANHTRVIDLRGRFAMPGFNDAHAHIHNAGVSLLGVELNGAGSLEEFLQRIRARRCEFEAGEWIYGRGWDHSLWPEARVPTRAELDQVSTDNPIYMERADGHSAVLNSLALERAGFGPDTPDPDGGLIVRAADGQPTGWIKERAMDHVEDLIPPLSRERRKQAYALAIEDALAHGVTSIQDDSVRSTGAGWEAFEALRDLKNEGRLDIRITAWLPFEASLEQLEQWRRDGGTTDPWLKTGLLKTNIDGSGGSLTASMLQPYASAPDNSGILIIPPDRLEAMVAERVSAGFQIAIHTIGDRANRVVLDAYQGVLDRSDHDDLRFRVEHAQFIHDDDVERFARLDVIASMQPSHLLSDLRWAPDILGAEREHEGYRWNSLLESGATLAFGTDYPVEPIDPMRGLYAAVTRQFESGGPPGGWIPREKITIEDALRAYTLGAAYAEFEEHRKATLIPGKFADIVVLSRDLTTANPREILSTRVLLTIVGGKIVYGAQGD